MSRNANISWVLITLALALALVLGIACPARDNWLIRAKHSCM